MPEGLPRRVLVQLVDELAVDDPADVYAFDVDPEAGSSCRDLAPHEQDDRRCQSSRDREDDEYPDRGLDFVLQRARDRRP